MLPDTIFELVDLEKFRQRPGMYLGIKIIDILKAFIDGYQYAVDSYKINDQRSREFERFRDWVLRFYYNENYTGGWNHMILEKCKGDQEKAVDKFFELYDKFRAS